MIVTDQLGRQVELKTTPVRIVSVVPSQTELLFDLGLEKEVAGITKFCVHPSDWHHNKTHVGGTKKLNPEIIRKINPDLIIANKEENEKDQIEALTKEFPVWISDIKNMNDALEMILEVSLITGKIASGEEIIGAIKKSFQSLPRIEPVKALYLIWRNPWMAAGSGTFISSMLPYAGFENALDSGRYPQLDLNTVDPGRFEYILLSSEPFPFNDKHVEEVSRIFPDKKIIIVDGEMFSWYGSRLKYAPEYFSNLIEKYKISPRADA